MSSIAVSATQSSAGRYPHPHSHANAFSPSSLTLVNPTHRANRPSIMLKILGGGSNILNSSVVDPAGRSLFSISSTSKYTRLISCKDNIKFATVEWDRPSPLIVFPRRKVKCKAWLPRARPETDSRVFTLGDSDSQFTWMNRSTSGYLIPANRDGLAVARWHIKSHSDELHLEIFQEALVESGLLEAIVLSLVLLRSGRSLGDTLGDLSINYCVAHYGIRTGTITS
ncbi:hypothetical protein BC827DRAFT_743248 [Russula dissimulans]|nr:hypothetical protein BC827DRAFT_743248 [Russula dissimulans]